MLISGKQRIIAIISTSRSDFGHLLPIAKAIQADPGLELRFVQPMTGSLDEALARNQIADTDGLKPLLRLEFTTPPDLILFLGDRGDLLEEVVQFVSSGVPFAHVHAGEETEGSTDNRVRHALSQLSHLYFVAHEDYRRRILQMGVDDWRIHVVGAPALDLIAPRPCAGKHVMLAWQPVTLEQALQAYYVAELQAALEDISLPLVIMSPNSDPGSRYIDQAWRKWSAGKDNATYCSVVPPETFWDFMADAAVLVGNSSAGLIEAASFSLPVVNVGSRQDGRIRGPNVIDVGYSRDEIKAGIQKALTVDFTAFIKGMANPLWQGGAAQKIVSVLRNVEISDKLLRKKFVNM